MSNYLSAERIKAAIKALSDTRAKAALLDFLIVKRTLVIKAATEVAITTKEPFGINPKLISALTKRFSIFLSLETRNRAIAAENIFRMALALRLEETHGRLLLNLNSYRISRV